MHISRLSGISPTPDPSMGHAFRKICPKVGRKTAASTMPASAPKTRRSARSLHSRGRLRQDSPRRPPARSRPGASCCRCSKSSRPGDVVAVKCCENRRNDRTSLHSPTGIEKGMFSGGRP
jgi:hypothetical protein